MQLSKGFRLLFRNASLLRWTCRALPPWVCQAGEDKRRQGEEKATLNWEAFLCPVQWCPYQLGDAGQKMNKTVFLSHREMVGTCKNFSVRPASPHRAEHSNNWQPWLKSGFESLCHWAKIKKNQPIKATSSIFIATLVWKNEDLRKIQYLNFIMWPYVTGKEEEVPWFSV